MTQWANALATEPSLAWTTIKFTEPIQLAIKVSESMKNYCAVGISGYPKNSLVSSLTAKLEGMAPWVWKLCDWINEQADDPSMGKCPDFLATSIIPGTRVDPLGNSDSLASNDLQALLNARLQASRGK